MAKYLLRVIRQVAVFELTGSERIVDADTEAQIHLRAREFLVESFPDQVHAPDIEVEIKKIGDDVPVTDRVASEFKPQNKTKFSPGAPF